MRISAKGRYALAACIEIAKHWQSNDYLSTIKMSQKLGISKIYLEQTLVNLKNAGIITSTKGHGGGYRLAREPEQITVWDILITVESALCETTDVNFDSIPVTQALEHAFTIMDSTLENCLKGIALPELVELAQDEIDDSAYMLYL